MIIADILNDEARRSERDKPERCTLPKLITQNCSVIKLLLIW